MQMLRGKLPMYASMLDFDKGRLLTGTRNDEVVAMDRYPLRTRFGISTVGRERTSIADWSHRRSCAMVGALNLRTNPKYCEISYALKTLAAGKRMTRQQFRHSERF